MEHLLQVGLVLLAGLAVVVADVLIKKAGTTSATFPGALFHPLMAAALGLYVVQIVLFAYVFVRRWELGIVALLQMACYAAACVLVGRFFFGEQITWMQGLGMLLAFCGVVLMSSSRG
jgi:drug/metabolite transporter (DMT)-like permease